MKKEKSSYISATAPHRFIPQPASGRSSALPCLAANIEYRINRRPKSLPKVSDNAIDWERYIDYRKSAVRCKVEHAFKIIKDTFNFRKVRYKGIAKNFNKLNVLFACANLLMVKRVQKDFRPVMG